MSLRVNLRRPVTLLAIHPPLSTMSKIPPTYNPAFDRVPLAPNARVLLGSTQPQKVGALPVSADQMHVISLPYSSGVVACSLDECVLSSNCNGQYLFIERNGETPETVFELVSPNNSDAMHELKVGSVIQVKEGDIIVVFQNDVSRYGFSVDWLTSVIVALPQLSKAEASHAFHNPQNLAHIYARVKDFVSCYYFSNGNNVVNAQKYQAYHQNMGERMVALNKIRLIAEETETDIEEPETAPETDPETRPAKKAKVASSMAGLSIATRTK